MPFRLRCLRLAVAITALGCTVDIASAFGPAAPPAVTTLAPYQSAVVSNLPASSRWPSSPMTGIPPAPARRSSSSRSLHVLQSAKIVPYAFRSVGVALAYKALKLQLQTKDAFARSLKSAIMSGTHYDNFRTVDAIAVLATGLMSYFNFAISNNDKLKSAKRAVKRFADRSEEDPERDAELAAAARTWKAAVRVKLACDFLSLVGMAAAGTRRDLYLGAVAVAGSTVAFLLVGGGRFQHNASGRLAPAADRSLSKAYAHDASVAAAALLAGFGNPGAARQACAGYVAFGYFGAALQGMAPKSKAKKKLNKAVFGNSAPTPGHSAEPKSEED